jgi:hypothetical protein
MKKTGGNIYIKAEYKRGKYVNIGPLCDAPQVQRVHKTPINFIIV